MIFARNLGAPEGPVLLGDGSWLVVETSPDRGCITRLSPDGVVRNVIATTGRPNGLAVDDRGGIWVAEASSPPALLCVQFDGRAERMATCCEGVPFLYPNDLAFGPDGALYLTDSGILSSVFSPGGKVRSDYSAFRPDGRVYWIHPETRKIRQLDSGIQFTNGIAFDPENNLYVCETLTGEVFRYIRRDGAMLGEREHFANVVHTLGSEGIRGPDGMKFGSNGNLYVAVYGQGDVMVVDRRGHLVDRIVTEGSQPTNLAFGPRGERKIYVTEQETGTFQVFDVETDGLTLWNSWPASQSAQR